MATVMMSLMSDQNVMLNVIYTADYLICVIIVGK